MEIREERPQMIVTGIVCDVCRQNCARENFGEHIDSSEYATLSASWGYCSNDKDMTWHECHLCEACFEKVKRFIEEDLKGMVRTGEGARG